jgi:hypothetical protein
MTLKVDATKFTIGDLIDIEEISGVPVASLGNAESASASAMLAMVYVQMRKTNPAVTIEDARALLPSDIDFVDTAKSENTEDPS